MRRWCTALLLTVLALHPGPVQALLRQPSAYVNFTPQEECADGLNEGNLYPQECAEGPYGEDWGRTGTNSVPFRWLGNHGVWRVSDAATLYLTRHRAYDTTMKRFLSQDPMGLGGGANLFAYANGNPLSYIDPLGLCAESGSYLGRSWDQLWKGNYSDNVTALGTVGQVGTGLLGVDLPGDIRDVTYDLTNWEWSWGHAGQTALDAVGLLPVIGALKYVDEVAEVLSPTAKSDMVTIYRGVGGEHPGFQSAMKGDAMPIGGHSDPILHNEWDTRSIFTSWSTDYKTAVDFALQDGAGGVVLKQTVPRSSLVISPDKFKEFEVLRVGPVKGATPIILSP